MEIGVRLKEAREAKGLSLEDIQKMTKIQPRYLKAIENGEFSLLPGNFYARAFIKEYASAVGLDSNELLQAYSHELPTVEDDTTIEYTRMQRSKKNSTTSAKNSPIFSLLPTIIVGILIVGVAFIIYLISSGFFSDQDGASTEPPSTEQNGGDEVQLPPETENNTDETSEQGNQGDDTDDSESTDEGTEQDDTTDQLEPSLELTEFENDQSTYDFTHYDDQVTLVLETEATNWLEIENENGESLYYGNFQSSDSPLELDVSESEQIYLRFGEPTKLSISLNDVSLQLSEDISSSTAVQRVWININQASE